MGIGLITGAHLKKKCMVVFFACMVFFWLWPVKPTKDVYYIIPRGTSAFKVQNDLFKLGLEPVYGAFLLRLFTTHQLKNIRAGEYRFEAGITPVEIMYKLTRGISVPYKLTIPEGLTVYQITQRLLRNPHLTGPIEVIPEEGSLLPTTVFYNKGQSRAQIIQRLQHMMSEKLANLCQKLNNPLLSNTHDILILASIVEQECVVPAERALVAGVYLNRLKIGMKMQADPCVIYAVTKGQAAGGYILKKADLMIDSPYNVYKYCGLPPTPICCPGEASIKAVLNPSDNKHLFFVTTGGGGHRFSNSYADHIKNIHTWKKTCKMQKT